MNAPSVHHSLADAALPAEGRWKRRFAYSHRGRSLPMDMLRGIAILLVLGRHYVVVPEHLGVLQPLAAGWTTIGWAGVDLFFVLSGFLVSGLIFAEYKQRATVDVRRFVIRRGFKIWPPYLVYIGVVALWLAWQRGGQWSTVWADLWPNVFHVQNYFHTPRLHTWSLAVEEHFYLVAAVAFGWALSRGHGDVRLKQLPAIVIGCLVALAAFRHVQYFRMGPAELNLYATHLRFDGLLVGTLLAYWTYFEPARIAFFTRHPIALMLGGAALAAPTLALSPEASAWSAGVGLTGVYIGFALIMLGWLNVAKLHGSWRRCFGSVPAALLGHVGFYSYSIYLWHVDLAQTPVRKLVQLAANVNVSPAMAWTLATGAYVLLAVGTGIVLARLLEAPSLALRDRLFPRTSRAATAPAIPATTAILPVTGAQTAGLRASPLGAVKP